MVLEKTLESPLDCKDIHPVHAKGDQSWVFIGRTDVETAILICWRRSQDGGGIRRVITFSYTNSLKEQQNGEQSLQNNF